MTPLLLSFALASGFLTDLSEQGFDLFDGELELTPHAVVVGGVHLEHVERSTSPDDQRQDRVTTIALSRAGFSGALGRFFSLESELELNAGPHGTSVWEGQAALQVRNQLVRFEIPDLFFSDRLKFEVGRVTDETSLNYFSHHTADQLLADTIARLPILMAGFNRGNGANLRYTLFDVVTLGASINAGNPTSTTGALMIGGTFPPFARFYEVPHSSVGRDARRFPVDSMHVVLFSPSIALNTKVVRAQASTQMFSADTNMNSDADAPIQGFNVRGGVDVTLFEDLLWDNGARMFLNVSRIENDVVKAEDLSVLRQKRYDAMTATTGIDIDVFEKSGVGADLAIIREREPGRPPTMTLSGNVGASLFVTDQISLGARGAFEQQCLDVDCTVDGLRSLFVTLRAAL